MQLWLRWFIWIIFCFIFIILHSMMIICPFGCHFCSSLPYKLQVTLVLYFSGCKSQSKGSSLKPHVSGNLIHDWYVLIVKITLTDGCFIENVLRGHSLEVVGIYIFLINSLTCREIAEYTYATSYSMTLIPFFKFNMLLIQLYYI